MAARGRGLYVRGLALGVRLAPPLIDLPALPLGLGCGQGRAPLGKPARVNGGGLGGLLHLLHGPGAAVGTGGADGGGAGAAGEIVARYLGGGTAPALFPLGQLLFQLGRHDAAGGGLGRFAALLFAFYFLGLVSFLYFGYGVPLLKKAAGRVLADAPLDSWVKHLFDPRHDVVRAGQGDGVPQGAVTLARTDRLTFRAVFRPPVGQAHQPFTFQLRGEPHTASQRVVRKVEREGIDRPGQQRGEGVVQKAEAVPKLDVVAVIGRPPSFGKAGRAG